MIPERRGKIINIASAAAFLVRVGVPNSVYAMTKAGTVMLTKALAEEWAQYSINVNAVAPGYFATPLVADRLKDPEASRSIIESTPLKRVGAAEDIMAAVVFFASDASNFITVDPLPRWRKNCAMSQTMDLSKFLKVRAIKYKDKPFLLGENESRQLSSV